MANRTIETLPPESEFQMKMPMPIKIAFEEVGKVFHAEIDEQNPHVGGIHTYGATEDEAFDEMVHAIDIQYKRHRGYTQDELQGRSRAKLNNLNRYMEPK